MKERAARLEAVNKQLLIEIEERRLAEEEARCNEIMLRAVLEQMPSGVVLAEAPSGKLLFGNAALEQILGQPFKPSDGPQEYEEYNACHPDGRPILDHEHAITRSLRSGQTVKGEEVHVVRPDGTRAIISVNSAPIRNPDQEIFAGVVVLDDITERKHAEEVLRQSEIKYRNLFENMAEEVHFWHLVRDETGRIRTWQLVDANPPTLHTWGRCRPGGCSESDFLILNRCAFFFFPVASGHTGKNERNGSEQSNQIPGHFNFLKACDQSAPSVRTHCHYSRVGTNVKPVTIARWTSWLSSGETFWSSRINLFYRRQPLDLTGNRFLFTKCLIFLQAKAAPELSLFRPTHRKWPVW